MTTPQLIITDYDPGLPGLRVADLWPSDATGPGAKLYLPPAPTGWKSTGRRSGPDPRFSYGRRGLGQGQG